ncbi:MAG: Rieske 2Fe-2S domain-containing protein [Alphaproteobacteria bacterium]|nr:Rieske 2Fe-2S domain-containing protein [Alphaproteobacteria bacterium]
MLSREENELLTRVGPGTPMGALMRRYWMPVLFSHQLDKPDGEPKRVRVLCEDLVAFRDSDGRIGLIDEACPHRTASMFFGRNEDCGLRCVYHGIKFDVEGNCVDVPCLPPGTAENQINAVKKNMKIKAYPCAEAGGVIWAYMGPADLKPELPDLEWMRVGDDQKFPTRHIQECNWLQGLEGGYDAPHLTFLHSGTAEESRRIVPSFYEVVPMDFGFVVGTGRDFGGDEIMWNINVMAMPFHKIISSQPHAAHMWMPIDDENTMLYSIDFQPDRPFTEEELARSKDFHGIHTENLPGTDIAIRNKANDYLIDRQLQAGGDSYTGMRGLGIQDCAVQESMGPIADRTKEHLLIGDTAIAQIRKLLLQTLKDMEAGKPLPGTDPSSFRGVRSARYEAPRGTVFLDEVDDRIRVAVDA